MEGHVRRAIGVAGVVLVALLFDGHAFALDEKANAKTDQSGITVTRLRNRVIDGRPGRGRRGDNSRCSWRIEHFTNSPIGGTTEYAVLGDQPSPEHEAYFVFCGDDFVTVTWRNRDGRASPPRVIAEELVDHLPIPFSGIGINPTQGITGLESWFWAEGYDGRPITYSDDRLGMRVAVEATPSTVTWDFGDGTAPVKADLGRAYPERSSVAHVYERSGGEQPYTVRLTVHFAVRYQVEGGPWTELPGITRSQSRPYSVIQLQAVRAR